MSGTKGKTISDAIGGFIDKRFILPVIATVATGGVIWGTTIAQMDTTKCRVDSLVVESKDTVKTMNQVLIVLERLSINQEYHTKAIENLNKKIEEVDKHGVVDP